MGDEPLDAAPERRRRYASASSLNELLEELLDDIRDRTAFERVVAVAGAGGEVIGASVGVPRDQVDAFVRAISDREWAHASPGSNLVRDGPDSPLARLRSLNAPVLVPARSPTDRVMAVVAVDTDPDDPGLQGVREALGAAAPFVFREAELHSLRADVQELGRQKLRSTRALDALPDPVLVMDGEARILLANRRAEELLMTGAGDSRGRRHAIQQNNLFFSAFRARMILDRDGPARSRELLLVDPVDGSDLLFEAFVRSFHGDEGVSDGLIVVLRDITDLKQATHELEVQFRHSVAAEHRARHESERLQVIIDNAGVPIFVTDPETNVVLMNREAERILDVGSSGSRDGSSRVRDIRTNDTRLAGFINEFLLQSDLRKEGRLTLVDPDEDRQFPALAVSTKILGEYREPTAVVTVLDDLTQEVENRRLAQKLRTLNAELEERVRAATKELAQRNKQLEAQRAELERASRMKSRFLAVMSHELRTPLNAVLGYNSLLREGLFGSMTDEQKDGLQRMRRAAEHLLSLVNDILDLSRVEAGKIQVTATDIEPRGFLKKLSESVRPLAAEKSLDYRLEVDPGAPTIRTDETRLRQVLLNLLANAVKFTDSGSVTLRSGPTEGGGIRIEVIDTGIGIPEDKLETIFEAFTQADQSATREHGGTGLGLTISRKLIAVMGGSLGVSSVPGEGTAFRVELPVSPPGTWEEPAAGPGEPERLPVEDPASEVLGAPGGGL